MALLDNWITGTNALVLRRRSQQATSQKALNTLDVQRKLFYIQMPSTPEGKLTKEIESRLKELRHSFSQRTELIKKRELAVNDEEHLESSEDETTDLQTSTSAAVQLDIGYTAEEEKHSLWHNPPRCLHIRRPPCLINLSPNKKPFLKAEDDRLYYVIVDDGGNLASKTSEAEILGLSTDVATTWRINLPTWLPTPKEFFNSTIESNGLFYIIWLFFVTLAFIYNAVGIPFREAFDIYDRMEHQNFWITCDSLADAIYLADLIVVKPKIQFIKNGIVMTDFKSCANNYAKSSNFKLDIISVVPFDLLSFIHGRVMARYRLLRFLKLPVMLEFFDRADLRVSVGFAVRLAKIIFYLLYVIHVESCGYYAFNRIHGLNASDWSIGNYDNNPYIYSFYVATKMATSIGNLPHATNLPEFIFMTTYWLTGVYVSAILIGQVIDILDGQRAEREAYKKLMNATLIYLKRIKAPEKDIDMVRTWFNHNWNQQKALDENMLIDALPLKLKNDVLIDVHYQTLSKVSLFKDCERTMIFDLIGKLKPVLFLPGALICKKGEVGLEMYIVKQGFVEVVGGPDDSIVFVTLKEGSVFGEISLLAIKGKNVRTATVRSKGYSTLFRLTKSDFEEAMKNYPAAYKLLRRKAQKMLLKDKKAAEKAAKEKEETEKKEAEALERAGSMEIIPDHRRLSTMPMVVDQVIQRRKSILLQKSMRPRVELDDEATMNQDLSSISDESVADIVTDEEYQKAQK
ncbi:hypothetical protein Aperf_G00000000246 [Anoplocephala perfoliata]